MAPSGSYQQNRQERPDDQPQTERSTSRLKTGGGFGVIHKKSNTGAKLGTVFVILVVLAGSGGSYHFYNDADGLLQHVETQDEFAVAAAYVMAHKGVDPRAIVPLRTGLEKGRVAFRKACAKALGSTKSPENTPFLGEAIRDPDAGVRAAAARAIGQNGQLNIKTYLEFAVQDPNDDVKIAACEAIAQLQLGDGIPYLITLLKHHNSHVTTAALESLETFLEDDRSFGSTQSEWRKWYEGEYD